jgi:hypothetical protein
MHRDAAGFACCGGGCYARREQKLAERLKNAGNAVRVAVRGCYHALDLQENTGIRVRLAGVPFMQL